MSVSIKACVYLEEIAHLIRTAERVIDIWDHLSPAETDTMLATKFNKQLTRLANSLKILEANNNPNMSVKVGIEPRKEEEKNSSE